MFVDVEHLLEGSIPSAAAALPAHAWAQFDQERENRSFILNSLRTLFLAPKSQPSHFHKLAHSFTRNENLTAAFPIISTLSVRSFASVRESTPVLSGAYALFVKSTREGVGGCPSELQVPLYEQPAKETQCSFRRVFPPTNQEARRTDRVDRTSGEEDATGVGCTCSPRKERVWAVLAAHAEVANCS